MTTYDKFVGWPNTLYSRGLQPLPTPAHLEIIKMSTPHKLYNRIQ